MVFTLRTYSFSFIPPWSVLAGVMVLPRNLTDQIKFALLFVYLLCELLQLLILYGLSIFIGVFRTRLFIFSNALSYRSWLSFWIHIGLGINNGFLILLLFLLWGRQSMVQALWHLLQHTVVSLIEKARFNELLKQVQVVLVELMIFLCNLGLKPVAFEANLNKVVSSLFQLFNAFVLLI